MTLQHEYFVFGLLHHTTNLCKWLSCPACRISRNSLLTGMFFGMIVFHMKCVLIYSTTVTIPERIRQVIIIHILRPLRKIPVTIRRF